MPELYLVCTEWKDVTDCLQMWGQKASKGLPGGQAGTYRLGSTVMDSTVRQNLLWEVVAKGLLFPKAPPCTDRLDALALSGLCHGPAPQAPGSEALMADSHICHFEGARLVTSCDKGLCLATAVVTTSTSHGGEEAAACSLRQRCPGEYLPWAWRWV